MEINNKTEDEDFLNFKIDKYVKEIIRDETMIYSQKIKKINHYDKQQDRNIVITNKAIYNLKKTTLKRRIDLNDVKGITSSRITDEFVIHCVEKEHDYNYISPSKKRIIELINNVLKDLTMKELKLKEFDLKLLKQYVTLKTEKNTNPNFSRMVDKDLTNITQFVYGFRVFDNTHHLKKKEKELKRLKLNFNEVKETTIDDFKIISVIGRGSFGKVYFVEYVHTGENFAMKVLKKEFLLEKDLVDNILLEKKILQSLDHSFLDSISFCFQSEDKIYLVMPFMIGGEIYTLLKDYKTFDIDMARFYAVQVALGLEQLHSYGFIYQDLKTENLLIDEDGYLKIVDFGNAKHLKLNEKANTLCGTHEYLAPEVITSEGHNSSSDWWSFGILLYEMVCGIPPFYNENLERMFELIKFAELKFPKKIKITEDFQDLITKLLDRNPETRLGANRGIEELKSHPFFAGFNFFDNILHKKINAPFKPKYDENNKLKYFDPSITNEKVDIGPKPSSKSLEEIKLNQYKFKDFN